jgi:protease-4
MKEKIKTVLKIIFFAAVVLTMVMIWYGVYIFWSDSGLSSAEGQFLCPKNSNVAVISIRGQIITYSGLLGPDVLDFTSSEEIVSYINKAEQDDDIKALIVEIDSYGGYPVAAEEIMNALKRMSKPTVTVIREGAVSAAYLIASGTDKIYASEVSDVGGIGVTGSYLDYSQQKKKDGVVYQQLSSGKFKDAGDPDKELTSEEKELLMRDIRIVHEAFVRGVAENRGLDIKKIEKLADGSTILGASAKENGLIDEIGDIYDAEAWISDELKIEPRLCLLKNGTTQRSDE